MTSPTTGERRKPVTAPAGNLRRKLADGLEKLGGVISWVAITLTCLLPLPILYDVVARSAGQPTDWAFEYTLYALIGAGFLANAWACKHGSHFRVTTLLNMFPNGKKALDRFAYLVMLAFSAIVTVAGAMLASYSFSNDIHASSLLGTPLYIPQALIPLGAGALFLQTLALLLRDEYPESHELI